MTGLLIRMLPGTRAGTLKNPSDRSASSREVIRIVLVLVYEVLILKF